LGRESALAAQVTYIMRYGENMPPVIITINLSLPFKVESVNCYLIKNDTGYLLIESGSSNQRDRLEKVLERAGCHPGNLRLIVITHGDFDHTAMPPICGTSLGPKLPCILLKLKPSKAGTCS